MNLELIRVIEEKLICLLLSNEVKDLFRRIIRSLRWKEVEENFDVLLLEKILRKFVVEIIKLSIDFILKDFGDIIFLLIVK